jgi:hypothetical protein
MNTKTRALVLLMTLLMVAPVASAAVSGGTYPNPPNFYITSTMVNLCKGTINYIPLTLTNTGVVGLGGMNPNGPSLQSVEATIANTKNLFAIANSTAQVGTINAANSVTFTVPVFVAANASSVVSAGFDINYYFDSIYTNSQALNLTFGVHSCPMPLSITVSPSTLVSGETENIYLNFTNSGNVTLNSITAKFSIPATDGTVLVSQPMQIASIAPRSSVLTKASIFVYRNATQTFPVNYTIEYFDNNNLEQIDSSSVVLSGGIISLTPSSETVAPTNPSPGGIFSISMVLTNIGTAGASAVSATALTPEGFTSFGSSTTFVGDIAPDSQAPVTLTLQGLNSTKPGQYTIPVRISYLNSLRQNQSITTNVPVTVGYSSSNTTRTGGKAYTKGNGGSGLLVLLLIIAVAVLAYLYYNERKRRSK